jgi:UDP-N-acetylglucosamine/UDP-N-acetylgalactosamine diphosphorylase
MADLQAVRETLKKYSQQHLLAFYDELSPARREALLEQIEAIDWPHVHQLIQTHVLHEPDIAPKGEIEPAPIIPARRQDEQTAAEILAARDKGKKLIAEGKVAAFVVAGGQGTRLGYEGPKGCLEATPVSHKPLFQLFAEQIRAASRRYRVNIPWYVMTSLANDVATRVFFRQHNYFGLDAKDVFFLVQGTMPAFDLAGKVLLKNRGSLALSPDGHGGSLLALRTSGALDDMAARGIEYISYFQVDNPLVHAIDPVFIGLHAKRDAEMSAKALPKRDPFEKLGNLCLVDGKLTVIEYSDMPEELATACREDGRLKFSAGSIAIHIISRSFIERLTQNNRLDLPFHRAVKKVAHIDAEGNAVKPEEPNAVKLEMFVFDALPKASETVVLETDRAEEFSPIKNATGEDSPATSLHDQIRRAATWLEEVGITVPRDADGQIAAALEISPLYADNVEVLAEKVDPKLVITAGQNLYLGSRGQTGGVK